jgi:amino acid adenylation domain-containing protein
MDTVSLLSPNQNNDEPAAAFGLSDCGKECHYHAAVDLVSASTLELQREATKLKVRVAAILHAAWGIVVARTSGRSDIVYGCEMLIGHEPTESADSKPTICPVQLRLEDASCVDLVLQAEQEFVDLPNRCGYAWPGTGPTTILRHGNGTKPVSRTCPLILTAGDRVDGQNLVVSTDGRVSPQRLAAYVGTAIELLVSALAVAPWTRAVALPVIPAEELTLISRFSNGAHTPESGGSAIHELFEEQVVRTPAQVAILCDSVELRYSELNSRSNRLARYLRSSGVGVDHVVALCLERGPDMIVCMLGVLKAGAAYLPLDPAYPTERVAHMMTSAEPSVVLTQERLLPSLPASAATIITTDAIYEVLESYAETNLSKFETGISSRDLAYVIYTSGSTGKPKGTAMPHSAMLNLMEWHRGVMGSCSGQRVLQFAALGFDVAFQEIFSTLTSGGILVLVEESLRKDPRALSSFLAEQRIDRLFVPPLILQSIAERFAGREDWVWRPRDIITAGEQLRISKEIAALFDRLPGCRLHNHYGPTESHVVTALTLPAGPDRWPGLPTIGTPIWNSQICILDSQRQLAPLGVIGEIYIGGAGVARGYLHRPQITAERFVPNPFSDDSSARLYRTGDIGRFDENGCIEYLGRNDRQVKIRGYRIELSEVESRLLEHERVRDAAVIVREDILGEKRLVAYTVLDELQNSAAAGGVEDLRAHMKAALPLHMIPSAFVTLERFPLTPNGKLDRRALPEPGVASHETAEFVAPCGEIEQFLAGLWCRLMGVERVGRDDNFFEMGGHSMSGMKLLAAIADRFRVQLDFELLFQHPTIREMASVVEARRSGISDPEPLEFEEGVV